MWDKACIWFGRTTVGALFYAMMAGAWQIAGKEAGMGYIVVSSAVLLALLIFCCIVYFIKASPDDPSHDAEGMSLQLRRILLAYFLVLGALLVGLLIDLNMVDFPETAVSVDITPSPQTFNPAAAANAKSDTSTVKAPDAATPAPTSAPVVTQVIPRTTAGNAPTTYFAVFGSNLSSAAIRFNGHERTTLHIGPTLLEAQPEIADLIGQGTITVDVITHKTGSDDAAPEGLISNGIVVSIGKPVAPLNLGCWPYLGCKNPPITRETQLLLIVLLAGALGCMIHALRSITVFLGNRSAVTSWFWWYITRPLLGMALALIFYAVLRGGFLAGSPADAKVVSPFGVLAMGALVGMFTEKASDKLAEIFGTLFQSKTEDASKDKLKKVSIKTSALPDGKANTVYTLQLEALDGSTPYTWTATGLPAGLALDSKTGIISGTPSAASPASPVKIVVKDSSGDTDTKTLHLEVKA
jgi:hypothetical protein